MLARCLQDACRARANCHVSSVSRSLRCTTTTRFCRARHSGRRFRSLHPGKGAATPPTAPLLGRMNCVTAPGLNEVETSDRYPLRQAWSRALCFLSKDAVACLHNSDILVDHDSMLQQEFPDEYAPTSIQCVWFVHTQTWPRWTNHSLQHLSLTSPFVSALPILRFCLSLAPCRCPTPRPPPFPPLTFPPPSLSALSATPGGLFSRLFLFFCAPSRWLRVCVLVLGCACVRAHQGACSCVRT
eukprot:2713602-Pleurochrysis_carterae.AAC.3